MVDPDMFQSYQELERDLTSHDHLDDQKDSNYKIPIMEDASQDS